MRLEKGRVRNPECNLYVKRACMFTWADLKRIAKKVFTRDPAGPVALQNYLYVLLYLCTSSRGIFSRYGFAPGSKEMLASYMILQSCFGSLVDAAKLFPQYLQGQILHFIREIAIGHLGEVKELDDG
jgi:hypothetical protein